MPAKPRVHRALEHDHASRTCRRRGSACRRSASPATVRAAGLVTSLAPITSDDVGARELAVDVVHLLELVVGDVGLGEQDVHVAGHAARRPGGSRRGPRRRASRARSRGRRPRAGPARRPCRSRGRRRPGARRRAGSRRRRRSSSAPSRRRRGATSAPPPPVPTPAKKTLAIERFIASAICLVRIEPDAPTSMPATISAVLSSAMPAAAARQAGERVQGARSRPACRRRRSAPRRARRARPRRAGSARTAARSPSRRRSPRPAPTAISSSAPLTALGVLEPALDQLLQLQERDVRAPEGDRADDRREQDRDQRLRAAGRRPRRGTRRR